MQHEFCCVNLVGESWRTCMENEPTNTRIPLCVDGWDVHSYATIPLSKLEVDIVIDDGFWDGGMSTTET